MKGVSQLKAMGIKSKQMLCSPLTGSSPQLTECGHMSPNCTASTFSPVPFRKQAASPQPKCRWGSCAQHLDLAREGCGAHPGQWRARPTLGASAPRPGAAPCAFRTALPGHAAGAEGNSYPSAAWGGGAGGPTNHGDKTLGHHLSDFQHFIGHIAQRLQGSSTQRP